MRCSSQLRCICLAIQHFTPQKNPAERSSAKLGIPTKIPATHLGGASQRNDLQSAPKKKTPHSGRFVIFNLLGKSFLSFNLLLAAISCWQSIRVRSQEFLRLHLSPFLPLLTKPFASIVPTPSLPEMRIQISPLLLGRSHWLRAIWQIACRYQSADEGGLVCSPMYTSSRIFRVLPGMRPY